MFLAEFTYCLLRGRLKRTCGQWGTNGSCWILSMHQPERPLYRLLLYLFLMLLFQSPFSLTSNGKNVRIRLELLGIISIWIFIFRSSWNLLAWFSSSATMYGANWLSRRNSAAYSFTVRSFCCNLINYSSISFCIVFEENLCRNFPRTGPKQWASPIWLLLPTTRFLLHLLIVS